MRTRAAVAGWLFVLAAGAAVAQPGPLDRAEQDRRTARVVHEAATIGSELYNRGGKAECYRLFQGTLLAVQPMIDHRPKLAVFVKEQLTKAEKLPAPEAAAELRKAIDAVMEETFSVLAPPKDGPPGAKKEPLWDRLGGEKTVRAAVKDFLGAAVADKDLNLSRGGKIQLDAANSARVELWLVEAVSLTTGGPLKGTGKELMAFGSDLKLTTSDVTRLALHFRDALEKNKVGIDERNEVTTIINNLRIQAGIK